MNTVQSITVIEGLLAFCFLALAVVASWKWSRDTTIMWSATFVIATASAFTPMPVKTAFITIWLIFAAMTILGAISPDFFARLTAGREKAIVGALSVIIALGIMVVAMYTKSQYVISLTLLTMVWAAYANRSHLNVYFNSETADPEVTPIASAPRVAVASTFGPSVVRDDPAKPLEDNPTNPSAREGTGLV